MGSGTSSGTKAYVSPSKPQGDRTWDDTGDTYEETPVEEPAPTEGDTTTGDGGGY